MTPQSLYSPQRIAVVGMSGAGKTTFGGQLARLLNYPVIEKDALTWDAGWKRVPKAEFTQRLLAELDSHPHQWIFDGNFGKSSDIIWRQADTLIWLDYSFTATLRQLMQRTAWRVKYQVELWNGNYETWRSVYGSQSIFRYALKSYHKCRTIYPALLKLPEYQHLNLVRFESPREADMWFLHFARTQRIARSTEPVERLFD